MIQCFAVSSPDTASIDLSKYRVKEILELNNLILSIKEDNMGFMWIGSFQNVFRYDGNELKTYQHLPYDTTSLLEYAVYSLNIDKNNYLWTATIGGMCRLNLSSNQEIFDRYPFPSFSHDPAKNYLGARSVLDDRKGNLWLGGNFNFLVKFNKTTGEYTKIELDSTF